MYLCSYILCCYSICFCRIYSYCLSANSCQSQVTVKGINLNSEQRKPHPPSASASAPNKRNVSVGSVQNEQYSLGTEPFHDHENEDEFIVHYNQCSLCLCVFDSHDASQAVKSVKKYMEKQVFGKPL